MINYTDVVLDSIVVHQIGNKLQDEGFKLSKEPLPLKEENRSYA